LLNYKQKKKKTLHDTYSDYLNVAHSIFTGNCKFFKMRVDKTESRVSAQTNIYGL